MQTEQLHAVCELRAFRKAAENAGMTERDIEGLTNYLSENPSAGDVIQGTGGCRKLRFAIRSNKKGKSGGIRTITLFTGESMPVFLVTVFAKGQKVTLTKSERNGLKQLSSLIVTEYSRRILPLAAGDIQ